MRYRISGPEEMIPFHIAFYQRQDRDQLIEYARQSVREERKPVLAAIAADGSLFGAIQDADSYFERFPIGYETLVHIGGEPTAQIVTGFSVSYPGTGLLVMPLPQSPELGQSRLSQVLAHLRGPLAHMPSGEWQDVTLVWGHPGQRRLLFLGSKFVVDTFPGLTTNVYLPQRADQLSNHFSALKTELGLTQCWVLHGNRVYHVEWSP